MSSIKIKSREELTETLVAQGFIDCGIGWIFDPNSNKAFHRSMFGLCGRRLIVDEHCNKYQEQFGYDFVDTEYKYAWCKEWLDRR